MTSKDSENLREDHDMLSSVINTGREMSPAKFFEMMAVILLRGHSKKERKVYLSNNLERIFRKSFANLLRGTVPLSREIRNALADLIAVDDEFPNERKIEFVFRRTGNRSDPGFESCVAAVVEGYLLREEKIEDGIQEAANQFGLEERAVKRYWNRHAKVWGFKAPRGRRPTKKKT